MSALPSFGDNTGDGSVRGAITFAAKARLGRLFSPKSRTPAAKLLHIGSGPRILPGFENIDFYAMKYWRFGHIGHDLRRPLPYADGAFTGAFSEHTLEHLAASDAIALLREIHRVLVPGSVLRMVVPDLERYVAFYNGQAPDPQFGGFASGCEAIWSLTQNHGHLSCWDAAMLTRQLVGAGFATATRVGFAAGQDPRLLQDQEERRWESLYVEAVA